MADIRDLQAKPFDEERFKAGIEKVRQVIKESSSNGAAANDPPEVAAVPDDGPSTNLETDTASKRTDRA